MQKLKQLLDPMAVALFEPDEKRLHSSETRRAIYVYKVCKKVFNHCKSTRTHRMYCASHTE